MTTLYRVFRITGSTMNEVGQALWQRPKSRLQSGPAFGRFEDALRYLEVQPDPEACAILTPSGKWITQAEIGW